MGEGWHLLGHNINELLPIIIGCGKQRFVGERKETLKNRCLTNSCQSISQRCLDDNGLIIGHLCLQVVNSLFVLIVSVLKQLVAHKNIDGGKPQHHSQHLFCCRRFSNALTGCLHLRLIVARGTDVFNSQTAGRQQSYC